MCSPARAYSCRALPLNLTVSTDQVNAYAPLKVEVSTNDPEELDEKGRQKPDSMDVQVKVTEQVFS